MKTIALTGGVACGKSTATHFLRDQGFMVIDADEITAQLFTKKEVIKEIQDHFQTTDKKELRKLIFERPQAREILESILHPKVKEKIKKNIVSYQKKKLAAVFVSIPLLFEKDLQGDYDEIIAVVCDLDKQLERLMKRDQIPQEEALTMIQSQWPVEQKAKLATFVLENNQKPKDLEKKLQKWLIDKGI